MSRKRKKKQTLDLSNEDRVILHYINKSINSIDILRKEIVQLNNCYISKNKHSFLKLKKNCDDINKNLFILNKYVTNTLSLVDKYYEKNKDYIEP